MPFVISIVIYCVWDAGIIWFSHMVNKWLFIQSTGFNRARIYSNVLNCTIHRQLSMKLTKYQCLKYHCIKNFYHRAFARKTIFENPFRDFKNFSNHSSKLSMHNTVTLHVSCWTALDWWPALNKTLINTKYLQ